MSNVVMFSDWEPISDLEYACPTCGATIHANFLKRHENWHNNLHEVIARLCLEAGYSDLIRKSARV